MRQKSQENVILEVVGISFAWIKQVKMRAKDLPRHEMKSDQLFIF